MEAITKATLGCTFACLLGFAFASQPAQPANSVPQVRRRISVEGVESLAGQPFSAEFETERTQTLLDGSHVRSLQHQKFYRDGEGRIRNEVYTHRGPYQEGSEELSSATITDVVGNVRYSLQPRNHTAQRSILFSELTQTPAAPPPSPTTTQQTQPQPKGTNETLGTQTIEGMSAEGSRFTMTLPINAQGNDAPLTYSNERWYSTEMGLEILQKMNDPRSGETVRRFTNILRGEPDPSLFQVPPDYTIRNPQ